MEASVTASAALTGQKSSNGAYNGPRQRSKGEEEMRGLPGSCSVTSTNRILYSMEILPFSTLRLSGRTGKNSDFPIPSGSYHCTDTVSQNHRTFGAGRDLQRSFVFSVLLAVLRLTTPSDDPHPHSTTGRLITMSLLRRNPLPPGASAAQ